MFNEGYSIEEIAKTAISRNDDLVLPIPARYADLWARAQQEGFRLRNFYFLSEPIWPGATAGYEPPSGDAWLLHWPSDPDEELRVFLHEITHAHPRSIPLMNDHTIADHERDENDAWATAWGLAQEWGLEAHFTFDHLQRYRHAEAEMRALLEAAGAVAGTKSYLLADRFLSYMGLVIDPERRTTVAEMAPIIHHARERPDFLRINRYRLRPWADRHETLEHDQGHQNILLPEPSLVSQEMLFKALAYSYRCWMRFSQETAQMRMGFTSLITPRDLYATIGRLNARLLLWHHCPARMQLSMYTDAPNCIGHGKYHLRMAYDNPRNGRTFIRELWVSVQGGEAVLDAEVALRQFMRAWASTAAWYWGDYATGCRREAEAMREQAALADAEEGRGLRSWRNCFSGRRENRPSANTRSPAFITFIIRTRA